jgi:hypothetical protein
MKVLDERMVNQINMNRKDVVLLGTASRQTAITLQGESIGNSASELRRSYDALLREGMICDQLHDGGDHPKVEGTVTFHQTELGEVVMAAFLIEQPMAKAVNGELVPMFITLTIVDADNNSETEHIIDMK